MNKTQLNTNQLSEKFKMKYIVKNIGDGVMDKVTGQSEAAFSSAKGDIDWNDYTYPPCLKLFHYVGDQVPQVHSKRVLVWKITHILIVIVNFLNFITNIVGTAQASTQQTFVFDGGIRIAISVFVFLFWLPLSIFMFILPFQVIMSYEQKKWIPYVLFSIAFLFYAIWCIADFADASGFVMCGRFFAASLGAAGFFSLVTAIISLIIAISTILCIFLYFRREVSEE